MSTNPSDNKSLQSRLWRWAVEAGGPNLQKQMDGIRKDLTPNGCSPEDRLRFWRIAAGECGHPDHIEEAQEFARDQGDAPDEISVSTDTGDADTVEPDPAVNGPDPVGPYGVPPQSTCNSRDEVLWVYSMIRRRGVALSEAPSEGAWTMLLFVQMGSRWLPKTAHDGTTSLEFVPGPNVGWFYTKIWLPITKTDTDKDGGRFEDDGRELLKLHEEFEVAIEREEMSA